MMVRLERGVRAMGNDCNGDVTPTRDETSASEFWTVLLSEPLYPSGVTVTLTIEMAATKEAANPIS